jgi:hypothetical protein
LSPLQAPQQRRVDQIPLADPLTVTAEVAQPSTGYSTLSARPRQKDVHSGYGENWVKTRRAAIEVVGNPLTDEAETPIAEAAE